MNIYLAHMTSENLNDFYDLVKADTPEEARKKVERAYGYGYEVEINIPIE